MNFRNLGVFFGLALLIPVLGHSADFNAGKELFSNHCAACHGMNGISVAASIPNLAGQKEQYLVTQLRDFRAGTRPGTTMPSMAGHLSEAEIENLAAYLATLSCK